MLWDVELHAAELGSSPGTGSCCVQGLVQAAAGEGVLSCRAQFGRKKGLKQSRSVWPLWRNIKQQAVGSVHLQYGLSSCCATRAVGPFLWGAWRWLQVLQGNSCPSTGNNGWKGFKHFWAKLTCVSLLSFLNFSQFFHFHGWNFPWAPC